MTKRIWAGAVVLVGVLLLAPAAAAQGTFPVSLEARLDAAIPVGDTDDLFGSGVGFGFDATFHLTPTFGLYAGYSRFELDVEGEADADVEIEGPHLGGKILLGTGGGVWTPYAQIGAVFDDGEAGIEAGLGALYPVGQNLSVTPLVRYRNTDDFEYVTLGVGLNVRL